jgi:hypothetical protein
VPNNEKREKEKMNQTASDQLFSLLAAPASVDSCYREIVRSDNAQTSIVFVGLNRIELYPESVAYEVIVRPDIYEDKMLEVIDLITFTYSDKIMKFIPRFGQSSASSGRFTSSAAVSFPSSSSSPETEIKSPIIKIFNESKDPSVKKVWNEFIIYFGCNSQFERVIFFHFLPLSLSSSSMTTVSYTDGREGSTGGSGGGGGGMTNEVGVVRKFASALLSGKNQDFLSFCHHTVYHYSEALFHEKMTIPYDHSSGPSSMNMICEGILDLSFIRDCQLISASLMNNRLVKEATSYDRQMKSDEMKLAKLMTILKPYYQKAAISLPIIPTSRSLASFPLSLKRNDAIKDPTVENCRLFLLKARKNYRTYCNNELLRKKSNSTVVGDKVRISLLFLFLSSSALLYPLTFSCLFLFCLSFSSLSLAFFSLCFLFFCLFITSASLLIIE